MVGDWEGITFVGDLSAGIYVGRRAEGCNRSGQPIAKDSARSTKAGGIEIRLLSEH